VHEAELAQVAAASVEMRPARSRSRCVAWIGQVLVDAQLQLAARQEGAPEQGRSRSIAFAHVEHDQPVSPASTRPFSSASDMNGLPRRLSEHLLDGLCRRSCSCAAPRVMCVGMVRLRSIVSTNICALALLQARILGELHAQAWTRQRPPYRAPGTPCASIQLQDAAEQAVI